MKTIIRFEPMLGGYLVMDNGEMFLIKEDDIKEVLSDITEPFVVYQTNHPLNSYSIPIRVQIQVTPYCNLACKTCGVATVKHKTSKPMSAEYIKSLLEKLLNIGILEIEWSGGEPLVHKDFLSLAEYAYNLGFNQCFLTNGINIEEAMIDHLKKYFHHIQISMDGVGEIYDDIVGKKIWNKFEKAISTLTPSILPTISVATVIQSKNAKNIYEIVDFCKKYNLKKLRLSLQVPIGRSSEINWLDYSQVVEDFRVSWPAVKKHASDNGVTVSCFLDKPQAKFNHNADINSLISPGGYSFLYVDAYGNIYPFPFLDGPEFYLGSVYKDSIEEVWYESKVLSSLRNISYRSFGCGKCTAECSFAERSLVYGFTGDINGRPLPHKECLLNLF